MNSEFQAEMKQFGNSPYRENVAFRKYLTLYMLGCIVCYMCLQMRLCYQVQYMFVCMCITYKQSPKFNVKDLCTWEYM